MNQEEYAVFQRELINLALKKCDDNTMTLAKRLGVRRETITRWYCGKHILKADNLLGVFECLGKKEVATYLTQMNVIDRVM